MVQVTDQIEISLAAREPPNAIGNILLIHGAASGAWAWEYFFEQLPDNYNLYAINWRGHYTSSNVNNAFASDYVFDQEAALEEMSNRNTLPTHLIGHSYGGATAVLQTAQTHHKISSLTLLAPVVPLKYTTIQRHIIPQLAPYFIKKDQAKGNDPDGLFGNMFLSKKRMEYYYNNYASHDHAKEKPGLIAGDGISEVWQKKLRRAYDIVSEQKIPTLILSARYDNVVVTSRQEKIAVAIGAQYKELQSGHYIPLDVEAENAVKLVTKFLQRLPNKLE